MLTWRLCTVHITAVIDDGQLFAEVVECKKRGKGGKKRGHLCSLNRAFIFGSLIHGRDSVAQSADARSFKLELGCKLFFMCLMSPCSVKFVPQKIGWNPSVPIFFFLPLCFSVKESCFVLFLHRVFQAN